LVTSPEARVAAVRASVASTGTLNKIDDHLEQDRFWVEQPAHSVAARIGDGVSTALVAPATAAPDRGALNKVNMLNKIDFGQLEQDRYDLEQGHLQVEQDRFRG
jgi:hypothetical protein